MFGYLLESPRLGNSNKYPKHMFYEEIRTKQDLSYISICSLCVLYSRKFILMTTSFRTNAVVVTKVHCIIASQIVKHVIPSNLRRMNTLLREKILPKVCCCTSEKRSTLKGKHLLPIGANNFPLE